MRDDRKSGSIRNIYKSVSPWAKARQCTEPHYNISEMIACRLSAKQQNERTDQWTDERTSLE